MQASQTKRLPTRLALVSLLAPILAGIVGHLVHRLPEQGFLIFAVGSLLGALCAIASLLRRERLLYAPVLGLLLNVPGCWLGLMLLALSGGAWT